MRIVSSESRPDSAERSPLEFLQPLQGMPSVAYAALGSFESKGGIYFIPRFTLMGPNSPDPIRIGLFAAIHGDEPAGAHALAELVRSFSGDPAWAEGFELRVYPVCNPTGFEDKTRHCRIGCDLNRLFWKASAQPEIAILEHELRSGRFNGIVQLHADDTSDGLYGFVRGHTLTENLLRPALREAGKILPRNINATIDGFAARGGIIYDAYEGVLAAPARMDPLPFEIVFETPQAAPLELQVQALLVAIRTILSEYRQLISFAANI